MINSNMFFLLDARAGSICLNNDSHELAKHHEEPSKFILIVGTAKECVNAANEGEYGDLCVVSDMGFNVLFEWLDDDGKWKIKKH